MPESGLLLSLLLFVTMRRSATLTSFLAVYSVHRAPLSIRLLPSSLAHPE